ncbi:MAG: leucyl aminopeptidase [Anaerolineales bacterium]|nr:leucyl aminopeptidase [Anaerolineales bacterium]
MNTHLTLVVTRPSDGPAGLRVLFACAPETLSLDSPGTEAGDVRFDQAARKAVVSLGKQDRINAETIRQAGGLLARWLARNGATEAGVELASLAISGLPAAQAAASLTEGLLLGAYQFTTYKSDKGGKTAPAISLLTEEITAVQPAVEEAQIVAEAVNLARDWSHEPPNVINPVSLAERTRALASAAGLKCSVLDDAQLAELGAGAIVSVGMGSEHPSRLILLEHQGDWGENVPPIVLVGKALTFDSGGYSLKSSEGIVGMKYDKSGAMAVIATLWAAARLKLRTPLLGVIAAAENMISGEAYHPDDIIQTLSGKTVEVISTDAEGRLVLADALTYVQQEYEPRQVIDIATLTGGVVVALGSVRAGLMSNDDDLAAALLAAGERAHERLWRLPLDEAYFELIKGTEADLKNSGGRKASAIIGGLFLKQFVSDGIPWAHVDIAGVMNSEKEGPYSPKGASGFGVRLFIEYLSSLT